VTFKRYSAKSANIKNEEKNLETFKLQRFELAIKSLSPFSFNVGETLFLVE